MADLDLFAAAGSLGFNAEPVMKAGAIAVDYFKRGKGVDWVIANVGGRKKPLIKEVIRVAEERRLVTIEMVKKAFAAERKLRADEA